MLDTGQGGKHGPISEDINDIYCETSGNVGLLPLK